MLSSSERSISRGEQITCVSFALNLPAIQVAFSRLLSLPLPSGRARPPCCFFLRLLLIDLKCNSTCDLFGPVFLQE